HPDMSVQEVFGKGAGGRHQRSPEIRWRIYDTLLNHPEAGRSHVNLLRAIKVEGYNRMQLGKQVSRLFSLGVLVVTNESGNPHSRHPRQTRIHPTFHGPLTELLAGMESLGDPLEAQRHQERAREIIDTPELIRTLMHKAKIFTPQENIQREEST